MNFELIITSSYKGKISYETHMHHRSSINIQRTRVFFQFVFFDTPPFSINGLMIKVVKLVAIFTPLITCSYNTKMCHQTKS